MARRATIIDIARAAGVPTLSKSRTRTSSASSSTTRRTRSSPNSPWCGPIATIVAKQLIKAAEGEDATMDILAGALVAATGDLREGVASFREKGAPRIKGLAE